MTPLDHAKAGIKDVMADMPEGERKALLAFVLEQLNLITPANDKPIAALLSKGHQ